MKLKPIQLLLPLAQEVIIATDNDLGGIASASYSAKVMTLQGREVRIAIPPEGKGFNEIHLLLDVSQHHSYLR